jgi:ribosomal protein L22
MIFTSEEDLQMIIQAIKNEDYQDAINLIKEIIEEEKIY